MKLHLSVLVLLASTFSSYAQDFDPPVIKTCVSPTKELCIESSYQGQLCRKKFASQCGEFIKQNLQKELPSNLTSKKTLLPFDIENKIEVRSAQSFEEKNTNLNISGMTGSFAALQIPANLANFQKVQPAPITPIGPININPILGNNTPIVVGPGNLEPVNNGPLTPITVIHNPELISKLKLDSALNKRERWSQNNGFESCEEWVFERFGNLSTLEDYVAKNLQNPVAIFSLIQKKNWQGLPKFTINFPETGALYIGNWIPDPDYKPYHLSAVVKNLNNSGVWNKNGFTSYKLDNSYLASGAKMPNYIPPKYIALVNNSLNKTTSRTLESQLARASEMSANNLSTDYLEQIQEMQITYLAKINDRINTAKDYNYWFTEQSWKCNAPASAGGGPSNCASAKEKMNLAFTQMNEDLKIIDAEITKILQNAEQLNCFDDNSSVCDWAPSVMLQTLDWALFKFRERREAEFQMCNTALRSQMNGANDQWVIPSEDYAWITINPNFAKYFKNPTNTKAWRDYPQDFITYMNFAWDYYKKVQQEIAEIKKFAKIQHPTLANKKQLGDIKNDSGFYGTDKLGGIGAGYAYNAGWMVRDYEQNYSAANIEAFSSFSLHAEVCGYKQDIVEFSGNTKTSGDRSLNNLYLKVLNLNFLPPYSKNESSGYHFLINASQSQRLFSKFTYISAFGVPIRLEAGAYASAGFASDVTNSFTRNSSTQELWMNNIGSFAPYTSITGYGMATADAGISRIGVKGRIDLINLSLPLKMNNKIYKREPDYLIAIQPNTKLDVDLTTMSGRMSVFMDTWLGDIESTIFSWRGPTFSYNLFESTSTQPFALKYSKQALELP